MNPINIIEPSLYDETGHSCSFIRNLVSTARNQPVPMACRVWYQKTSPLAFSALGVEERRYFGRMLYKLQIWTLLRAWNFTTQGKVFIPTCDLTTLRTLANARPKGVPGHSMFVFVHWFRQTEKRAAILRRIARQLPELHVITLNEEVESYFKDAGFSHVNKVNYPYLISDETTPTPFSHLLFIGAARSNKGFSEMIDYLDYLSGKGSDLPFVIQTSRPGRKGYDTPTRNALSKLDRINYSHLRLIPETMTSDEYARALPGAICFQLYDPVAFRLSVSGVTLDAIGSLSPILCRRGTWTFRIVEQYGIGVCIDEVNNETINIAIARLVSEYSNYQERLLECRAIFAKDYHPSHVIDCLN